MDEIVDGAWLACQVGDVSAGGIAATVTELVRRDEILPGTKLPTVRSLAADLGVSPGTISAAWGLLRRRRIVETRRRGGTTVVGHPGAPHPTRFDSVGNYGDRLKTDLTFATPDPALLPALDQALLAALGNESLNTYSREPITPRLRSSLVPQWPFKADSWLAVNGGYEGLFLLCMTSIGHGETVAIEDPTAPRLLDMLGIVGARLVPVRCDRSGPLPDDLRRAVEAGAVAFLYQPRAQCPCGHTVSKSRSAVLARILKGTGVLVVEDDGVGEAASTTMHSMGRLLPHQTVLVRSYAKAYGPDLRIGVMAGASAPIRLAQDYRNFGARWTSRILQDALAVLVTDATCASQLARAREHYNERRKALVDALAVRGLRVDAQEGLSIWVPVENEEYALVTFAAHGIAAGPGSRFYVSDGRAHLRIATSRLEHGYDEVADCTILASRS
ncbi:MAG: aminotransferase class I/II-fold pyridoxal phosphate-dependent enzyme [Nocardioidaceae bacterium]